MKINFTKKEYKALIDIVEIANWVMTAHSISDETNSETYKLTQKIYSYSKDFGLENLIEFAEELDEFLPTRVYDETSEVRSFLDDYENEVFWDELVDRLVDRDIENEIGEEKFSELSFEERFEIRSVFEEKYYDEFDENDLENLKIMNHLSLN